MNDFIVFALLACRYMQEDKFQIDDELKHHVLNWLCSQDKTFYTTGISNFTGQ
jgi:hypothetical protein